MTVSNQNPVADSLLTPADSVSFDLTPNGALTFFQVSVLGETTEVAIVSSTFQAGFSGTQTIDGGVRSVSFSRSAGWDASPFTVKVDWIDDGGTQSESWSFQLANENLYPDLMQPRNPVAQGNLIVTDNGVSVLSDAGWIDLVGFTVVNLGNGKVRITDMGGGGGSGYPGIGQYTLSASTAAGVPGAGLFRFDNAAQGSVTAMYVDDTDRTGVDLGPALGALKVGQILKLQDTAAQDTGSLWQITSAPADQAGWWSIGVTRVGVGTNDLGTTNPTSFSGPVGQASGLDVAVTWEFDDVDTAATLPGNGKFKINNATPGLETIWYVDDDAVEGSMLSALGNLGSGNVIRVVNGSEFACWKVSSVTNDTGFYHFTGSYVAVSPGFNFADGDLLAFFFNAEGASATDLDGVINAGTPDNDVDVPVADPIILRDAAAALTPLSIVNTQTQSGDGSNPSALEVILDSVLDPGIVVRNPDSSRKFALRNNGIVFLPKDTVAAPSQYVIGVQTREPTDTEDGGNLWINAGTAQNAASTGGDLLLFAGFGGVADGVAKLGPFNTKNVELGAAAIPTDVKGVLNAEENITMVAGKTVDGRDVSVDGAKLDTVETNATVGNPMAYWEFDDVDTANTNPGTGKFKIDNVTPGFETAWYIHETDSNGDSQLNTFGSLKSGNTIILRNGDSGWAAFKLGADPVDEGAWWSFAGAYVGSGNAFPGFADTDIPSFEYTEFGASGVGSGDVTSSEAGGTVDGELVVFDDTSGKLVRKSTITETTINNNTSKLAGIEAGATADQTGAEIKTAYEAEPNAYTDAKDTKLTGVETGATADQTGAEIKAAYEAEPNAYTDAKDTKLTGIETGATADQTGAEIKTAYEAEPNAYTDAKDTKLTGIETAADVTDTANVTAAGALMDSEVDANLKTLVLPATTTISAFGASLVDDADAATARTTLDAARANLSGAGAPGVATGNGYPLGTTYADTTGDVGYILVDNSTGANVWWTAPAGAGDVTGGSTSLANEVPTYTDTGGKTIGRSGMLFGSGSAGTGTRSIGSNVSAMVGGHIVTGGTIRATNFGGVAVGYVSQGAGTTLAEIASTGFAGTAIGAAVTFVSTGTSRITASATGTTALGYALNFGTGTSAVEATVQGAFAQGMAQAGGNVSASADGAFAAGFVNSSGGVIEAVSTARGAFVHGYANIGIIRATGGDGAFASGSASGTGTSIIASAAGAFATGSCTSSGKIAASGAGAFAGGLAVTNTTTASGAGSFAWGDCTSAAITASATNSAQFGEGVNARADSLQVGSGVMLLGPLTTAPSGLANGMIWTGADGKMRCYTNGTTRLLGVGAT